MDSRNRALVGVLTASEVEPRSHDELIERWESEQIPNCDGHELYVRPFRWMLLLRARNMVHGSVRVCELGMGAGERHV